ncbi:SDR family oxidoreductase [Gammaproteobacteria bacterium]|jgi:dTDP-4-dehydrorhamnose reductase|nr:SDR family oxidoreductase [Gammaproteobacteria bacterium]
MRFLVLGANGMLGHSIYSYLLSRGADAHGIMRGALDPNIPSSFRENIHLVESTNTEDLSSKILELNPDYIINCIGVIKQNAYSEDKYHSLLINAILPHQLVKIAAIVSATLVHFSTDCIFSGSRGGYEDNDLPDCQDIYGMTKYLGEVDHEKHITLRTSMIGHELGSNVSLLEWFLSQTKKVNGYTNAIFSGLPTCVIAEILYENIVGKNIPGGIYNLAADPIDKFTLLSKIAQIYGKEISILPHSIPRINRSLKGNKFQKLIQYKLPSWDKLIEKMYVDFIENPIYENKQQKT